MSESVRPSYAIPSAAYAAVYARRHAMRVIVPAALPAAAAAAAGCFDTRWWLTGLMWLMIIVPMFLTLGWLSLMARPDMVLRQRPQQLDIDDAGNCTVRFLHYSDNDGENAPASPPAGTFAFTPDDISKADDDGRRTTIYFRSGSKFDFLIIPSPLLTPLQQHLTQNGHR